MKSFRLSNFVVTFAALLMAGCSPTSTVKVGYLQNTLPDGAEASYFTFDGTERYSFKVKEGDEIRFVFDYRVEKGSLMFQLVSPGGEVVWTSPAHVDSGSTSVSTDALESGRYKVLVIGEETGGGYTYTCTILEDPEN